MSHDLRPPVADKSLSQILNEILIFGVEDLARANGSMDAGEQRKLADYFGKKIGELKDAAPPLCFVHQHLEEAGALEVQIGGNNCVACSLNEREELLKILAEHVPQGSAPDSVTLLRELLATLPKPVR